MKWNEFEDSKKIFYFVIIFVFGWLIRMVDPVAGVFMSIYYIVVSRVLYQKEERSKILGFNTPKRNSIPLISVYVPLKVIIFIPIFLFLPMINDILPSAWELSGHSFALMVFVAWLVVGTFTVYAEEIFFRGFAKDAIEDMIKVNKNADPKTLTKGRLKALIIYSLLFGVSHLNVVWADLYLWGIIQPDIVLIIMGLTCITIMGFLLGIIRIKSDSLWTAMIAHSIGNFFMVFIPALMFLLAL